MDKYLLLFRTDSNVEDLYANMSPEDMEAELGKWNAWIGGIAAQGKFEGSEALQPTGKIVTGSKRVVSDGPYVESKELVSGYLLLKADSMEEAIELSQGCPIYDHEGIVEVRQIQVYG
jgi:hypothetical protein